MTYYPDNDPFILKYDDCSRQDRLVINPAAAMGTVFQALCLLGDQECQIVPDSHTERLYVVGGSFNRADLLDQLSLQPVIDELNSEWKVLTDDRHRYTTHVLSSLLATGQSLFWLQQIGEDRPIRFVSRKVVEELRIEQQESNQELFPVYKKGSGVLFCTDKRRKSNR